MARRSSFSIVSAESNKLFRTEKIFFIEGHGTLRKILPRVIDFTMRNKDAAQLRADWVPHARGEVLEVGIGSGLNLPFYSSEVQHVYGVDPSAELQRMAPTRTVNAPMKVEFLSQSVEEVLPLSDKSIDTA